METKKDGTGTCYKRVSKKGTSYYNGKFTLDGKDYWLKLFQTKTQDGQPAVSFIIDPREPIAEHPKENVGDLYQKVKNGEMSAADLPDSYFDDPLPESWK